MLDWQRFSNPAGKVYEYALTLRPVSFATVPKGFIDFRSDPKWRHGVVRYGKPLSRDDIEHFDLEPLDPLDPINVMRRLQAFRDRVYLEFAEKQIVVLPTSTGKVSLTYSTRPGVDFQMTYWTPDEVPTGHLDLNDFDEAARALWGATTPEGRRL